MKFTRYIAALASLLLLLGAPIASAHVLRQDNGVSAVLHIAPFDAPVSGEPTRIEVEFSNEAGTFSLANYHTRLQLVEGTATIHTYTVEPQYFGTTTEGLAVITFPKADVYSLSLVGTATSAGVPNFAVRYQVRVTPGQTATSKQANGWIDVVAVSATAFVLLSMFAVWQIQSGGRYKSKPTK